MLTRYASAVTSGAIMTFGLLFVMQLLITLQPGAASKPTPGIGVDWIKMRIPDPPVVPRDELVDKKKLTETMTPPERPKTSGSGEPLLVGRTGPTPPTGYSVPKLTEFTDGPLVSLVRVSPVYPARALSSGIEGHVVVQFDVTGRGQVINVVIVESTDDVFDSAAIKAAERFKFRPRVVNGQTLASYGIRNMFTFRLNDQ